MIQVPAQGKKREAIRAIVEAFTQIDPVSAFITRIFQFTNPPKSQQEMKEWAAQVTERVNAHDDILKIFEDILMPKMRISSDALTVAKVLLDMSDDGIDGFVEFGVLYDTLSDMPRPAVEDAVGELQYFGFVVQENIIIHIKFSLFFEFDKMFNGFDSEEDARVLASMIVDDDKYKNIHTLFETAMWSHRRFNPALGYIIENFPAIKVSNEKQPYFPTTYLFINNESKFALKEFARKYNS